VKVRDLIKLIEEDGWRHVKTRGVIGNSNIAQSRAA
jgi:hypothetical protein